MQDQPVKRAVRATVTPPSATGRVSSARSDWRAAERAEFVIEMVGGTRRAAELLDVAPSQPSRWAAGNSVPNPEKARLLLDLDHVLSRTLLVWTPAVATDWLSSPNARLNGATPMAWLHVHGPSEVLEALDEEASGSYA